MAGRTWAGAFLRGDLGRARPCGRRTLERAFGGARRRALEGLEFPPRRHVAVAACPARADTEAQWLRVYRAPERRAAGRYAWAAEQLRRAGLCAPRVRRWSLLPGADGWRVGLLVSAVPGRLLEQGGPELARTFGAELARWHAVDLAHCPAEPRDLPARHLELSPDEWRTRLARGPGLSAAGIEAALSTREALASPSVHGPLGFTHGDMTRANVLRDEAGALAWVDLDTAGPGPLRLDLVGAHLHLVLGRPEAAVRLDAAYFAPSAGAADAETQRRARAAWDAAALHWYRYELLRRTLLARQFPRPARDAEQRARQARRLVWARAALAVQAGRAPSASAALAEIGERARHAEGVSLSAAGSG